LNDRGTTSEGGEQATKLMQVDVPVITNELCNEQYEDRITPRMICAGYPDGGRDSCQGEIYVFACFGFQGV